MKFINGDILNIKYGILCHQVNCQLVMGAGLAKQIRNKYPRVYNEYVRDFKNVLPKSRLGNCQLVEIIPHTLYIANMFSQFHYLPRGKCHTDYFAFKKCLNYINKNNKDNLPVVFPYKIGCGLAGGSWNIIDKLINDIIPDSIIVNNERK